MNVRLNCYEFRGDQYAGQFGTGVAFDRSAELNVPQPDTGYPWSEAYGGDKGEVWCVWADPNISNNAGHVYFALQADTPPLVRDYTPGCDEEAERESKEAHKKGKDEAAAEVLKKIIVARTIAMAAARLTNGPVIDPPAQTTDDDEDEDTPAYAGHYAVTAPKASTETTLQMCYGDGFCETRAIPSGSGSRTFSFSRVFSSTGTYVQTAAILETGARAVPAATRVSSGGASRGTCERADGATGSTCCGTNASLALNEPMVPLTTTEGFDSDPSEGFDSYPSFPELIC